MTPGDEPLNILLVEDNPGDIRLVREAFAESTVDSSLSTVTDGEKALDCLSRRTKNDPRLDLVLLDLNVPKVPGRTILEEITAESGFRSVPIAVLTSSESHDDIHETYELGADSYFIKPTDPTEFFSLIQTIVESAADSGEIPLGKYSEIDRTE